MRHDETKCSKFQQSNWLVLLICIKFSNSLLHLLCLSINDTGIINQILGQFGIGPLPLIRNNGAVVFGMVYNFLPYIILPLYSVINKNHGF